MIRSTVLFRRLVALCTGAVLALGAAGCGDSLEDAATVTLSTGDSGEKLVVHISRDDLQDDLRVMRANDDFVDFLKQNGLEIPESDSSVGSAITAIWLSDLVNQAVVDAELEERDLTVTEEDRKAVADQINESYGGAKIFKQFPKDFRDAVIDRAARWNALLTRGAAETEPPTEEDARTFYEENSDQLGACASGRSVAHILVATEAEADDVKVELDGGADFAELAKERSTDPTAAENAGDLGCLQDGAFVAAFEAAAKAATIGVPTAPVKTEFGFHVILASEFTPPSFEAMKDQIVEYLASQAEQTAGQEINTVIQERLADAEVDVDPRYGKWVTGDAQSGPHVEEPDAPEPSEGRDGSSTTTLSPADSLITVPAQGG